MRRFCSTVLAGMALVLSIPAVAQDDGPAAVAAQSADESSGDDVLGAMFSAFKPEPLTAEQQARLPKAKAIIEKMIPPGTMDELMGSMFDKMLGPIMDLAGKPSSAEVARLLGADKDALVLDEADSAEAITLLDPAWRERQDAVMASTQALVGKMMMAMEPIMKKAMAEAYAVHFDDKELTDIDAFFSTDSGIAFARKSFTMSSDPRLVGAMLQGLPTMMEPMAEMESEMKAAVAAVPAPRTYADLTDAQRGRLAELTGFDQSEIEQGMAQAAAARDESGEDAWSEEEASGETY